MKKVLYVSYDGLTDNLGQSQILPYLIGLSKNGHKFRVISFEKPERYNSQKAKIQKICDTNNIKWIPQSYTKSPPVLSTLKDMRKMRKKAKQEYQKENFDIVHCRSYLPGLIGLYLKKKFGVRFIFDIRGFWADERIEGGIWDRSKPIYNWIFSYFKRKEVQLFQQADHIISLTNAGLKIIANHKKWKVSKSKITVIPCCVDLDHFDPAQINPLAKENLSKALKINVNQKVLGYIGSIGTWYMLDEMLDFFRVQYEKSNAYVFLFVTQESSDKIWQRAIGKGLPKESIKIVSAAHKYVPLHISLFDFSIFFIRPTFSKQASSPTKQGELMAMGIPVVCNSGVGDTDKIVQHYKSGVVLEEFSDKAYETIDLEPSNFNPASIRKGAQDAYSLKGGIEKYHSIYFNS
jgi:glycosyltransferase involved in cell wall biosynthesis